MLVPQTEVCGVYVALLESGSAGSGVGREGREFVALRGDCRERFASGDAGLFEEG